MIQPHSAADREQVVDTMIGLTRLTTCIAPSLSAAAAWNSILHYDGAASFG
jgi:hypothetical protein